MINEGTVQEPRSARAGPFLSALERGGGPALREYVARTGLPEVFVCAQDQLALSVRVAPTETRLVLRSVPAPSTPYQGGPDRIEAAVNIDGHEHFLGNLDGRFVSTEVAGGFTGRVIGVQPIGDQAVIHRFTYTPEHL